MSDIAGKKLWG